jgi:hypothetical protein
MLRRVTAALYEAPLGARIQVVAQSQDNTGVQEATFEYGGAFREERILGLPGCSFTVDSKERLQVGVVFDPNAPGAARYDLFEVENGVKIDLDKSVTHSAGDPLISFTIEPLPVEEAAFELGTGFAPRVATRTPTTKTLAGRKAAKKAKPRATKKVAAKKKKRPARNATPRSTKVSPKHKTSRKRR